MESTPEEIIKGLSAPIPVHYHTDFEPRLTKRTMYDLEALHANALALIQQLAQSNAQLAIGKAILAAENAAMLETIKRMAHSGGVCIGCVHMDDEPTILEHCEDLAFDCEKCPTPCACHSCKEGSNYTWKGVASDDEDA